MLGISLGCIFVCCNLVSQGEKLELRIQSSVSVSVACHWNWIDCNEVEEIEDNLVY